MQMSESELSALLANNPAIKIHEFKSNQNHTTFVNAADVQCKPKTKKVKYRNKKVYVFEDGYADITKSIENHGKVTEVFDSQKEFHRYKELRQMELSGMIFDLKRQVPITILEPFSYQGKQIKAIKYKADFMYYRKNESNPTVEDVKGIDRNSGKVLATPEFLLKWKLLKSKYPNWEFVIV